MDILATASDTLYSVCATVALTVTTLKEWFGFILQLNFVIVTTLFTTLCDTVSFVVVVLNFVLQGLFITFMYIFEFLSEIYSCISALLLLLWRIVVLLYKVVFFLLTGIETLLTGLWNGGQLTFKTLQQGASDVMETCESTSGYIAMAVHSLMTGVSNVFTSVGFIATTCVVTTWEGLAYIPATLSYLPRYFTDWLNGLCMWFMLWTSRAFRSAAPETYLGCMIVGILCICSRFVSIHRFRRIIFHSIYRFWKIIVQSCHQRTIRSEARSVFPLDRGFESDAEDQESDAGDYDIDADSHTSDDNHADSDGEASEVHTEITLSDNDTDDEQSDGTESDVSLYSQSFSSGESEPEIEVQLPAERERFTLRSRSATPSIALKTMTSADFEREIERERDKRKCVVCQDANKSVLILPCRHMCLCIECASQIVHCHQVDRRVCPLCRTRIEKVMNVYV